MNSVSRALAAGAGLVAAGAVIVGLLAGTALYGLWGLAGGAAALIAYYAANLAAPARFPDFFASIFPVLNWTAGLALLSVSVVFLQRELRLRRKYEAAARKSEERLRVITETGRLHRCRGALPVQ